MDRPGNPTSLARAVETLQAQGRYTFTSRELGTALGSSPVALQAALRRLRNAGRIATPRRGFHVIVPPEYRAAGCPPANWFIHDFMCNQGRPYYVGLLSAAAIHGSAHQQPMAFQILTDRPARPARAGRVRIEFHVRRSCEKAAVVELSTDTGSMRISTPETTCLDLVRFAPACGGIANVATILSEWGERLREDALEAEARLYAAPEIQRLGFLLEHVGATGASEALEHVLAGLRVRTVLLAPGEGAGKAAPDPRWRVVPNVDFEPEA